MTQRKCFNLCAKVISNVMIANNSIYTTFSYPKIEASFIDFFLSTSPFNNVYNLYYLFDTFPSSVFDNQSISCVHHD